MTEVFPCDREVLRLPGPVGVIEALTSCADPARAVPVTAVVLHPHTLHGGTMQNKVVHTLARTFTELGLRTVRFNFRGAGGSEGEHDHGTGETHDALAVLEWVRAHRPHDQLWLAGFSFGSYVALRVANAFPVDRLVTVAPPVHMYDFDALAVPRCPWLVIQGDQDEIVPAEQVTTWAQRLNPAPELRVLPGVGHFFHQRLHDLRAVLTESLAPTLPAAP